MSRFLDRLADRLGAGDAAVARTTNRGSDGERHPKRLSTNGVVAERLLNDRRRRSQRLLDAEELLQRDTVSQATQLLHQEFVEILRKTNHTRQSSPEALGMGMRQQLTQWFLEGRGIVRSKYLYYGIR